MPSVTQAYRVRLPYPPDVIWSWHERPGAFKRLAPPWETMRFLQGDQGLGVGAKTIFQVQKGGIWVTWEAEHVACEAPNLFVDEQRQGPFAVWRHVHRFEPTEDGTELSDTITWSPPGGPLGAVAVPSLRSVNDRMFRFRHRRTQHDLWRHAAFADRPRRKVAITGVTGLVGSALEAFLTTGGHEVVRVVRRDPQPGDCLWDVRAGTIDVQALEGVDAIVHLAGASVAERWTPEHKRAIRDSRVDGTRLIVDAIRRMQTRPEVLVSASAVGLYGDRGDTVLTEDSEPGTGFLAEVGRAWEAEAEAVEALGVRRVTPRIGIVMTSAGAALGTMLPIFRAGGGGPIGDGRQWVSWIALDDLIGMIYAGLMDPSWSGPYNATAPNPVTQREQARLIGRVLGRPAVVPAPATAIRTLMGEMGEEMLLAGQRVLPKRAQEAGFRFAHTELADAVRATLGKA